MHNMKDYQNSYDNLSYTPEQKRKIAAQAAAAAARGKSDNKWMRLGKIAAAAACLVCVLTVSAEAAGIPTPVSGFLAPIFGGSVAQTEVIDKIGHPIEASDTDNGITIRADAVIGDEYNICMVYTIRRDDGTPLLPEGVTANHLLSGAFDNTFYGKSGHGNAYFVDTVPGDAEIQYVTVFSSDEPVNQGQATAEFHDLRCYNDSMEEATTVLEGDWKFRFDIAYEDSSICLGGGETFSQDGLNFTITEIRLSPLAISVAYEADSQVQWSNAESGKLPEEDNREYERYQGNIEVLLTKKDGTVLDLTMTGGSLSPENGKTIGVKGTVFDQIIPLEDMESISVGGIVFSIEDNHNA